MLVNLKRNVSNFELLSENSKSVSTLNAAFTSSLIWLSDKFIETNASSTQPAEDSEKTFPSSTASTNLLATKKKSKKKMDPTSELEVVHLADILKCGRIGIRLGPFTRSRFRAREAPLTLFYVYRPAFRSHGLVSSTLLIV